MQVNILTSKDLLVRVVGVVRPHRPRIGLARQHQLKRIAVKVLQQSEQFGGGHAFCFSLQVMQTRVHGMAFKRASAMGSPQSRQTP